MNVTTSFLAMSFPPLLYGDWRAQPKGRDRLCARLGARRFLPPRLAGVGCFFLQNGFRYTQSKGRDRLCARFRGRLPLLARLTRPDRLGTRDRNWFRRGPGWRGLRADEPGAVVGPG